MKKLFLSLALALCAISSPVNAAQVVAAGLKGTYNNLPQEIQAISPIHGAVKPITPDYHYPLNRYEAEHAHQIENELKLLRSIEYNYPVFDQEYRAKRPAYDNDTQENEH